MSISKVELKELPDSALSSTSLKAGLEGEEGTWYRFSQGLSSPRHHCGDTEDKRVGQETVAVRVAAEGHRYPYVQT